MKKLNKLLVSTFSLAGVVLFSGCSSKNFSIDSSLHSLANSKLGTYKIDGEKYYPFMPETGFYVRGKASWYGKDFHGKRTANGEIYDMYKLTAAHKTFPMNTIVKITNLNNNKSVIVRINDRGPYIKDRVIDLSYAAFNQLSASSSGVIPISAEVVGFVNHKFANAYK